MPRKKKSIKPRDIGVDPIYESELLQRFINVVMWRGKKNAARKIVYEAVGVLEKKFGGKEKALDVFYKAFNQIVPLVEVSSRRVGGSVYQIPREVAQGRGRSLAIRWLIDAAASRSGKTMGSRLGSELLEAYEGRGGAFKKKLDVHKMAEANRAFSHYAW
ncbi:MAG: 30S ribosomal protein S7 [Epsilonproteobacteria bacterium]|nr:30S ribosomal protein S7 [Campylobacterota bacterium]|tara:strand:- start:1800 stop:2279 length:480 start_codon:yes stop_codon:yes gene_type:complete